jgi:hypothetical protein
MGDYSSSTMESRRYTGTRLEMKNVLDIEMGSYSAQQRRLNLLFYALFKGGFLVMHRGSPLVKTKTCSAQCSSSLLCSVHSHIPLCTAEDRSRQANWVSNTGCSHELSPRTLKVKPIQPEDPSKRLVHRTKKRTREAFNRKGLAGSKD